VRLCLGAHLSLLGCCIILANGLWFQSLGAVFGLWLACELTGHLGGRVFSAKCVPSSAFWIRMHTTKLPI